MTVPARGRPLLNELNHNETELTWRQWKAVEGGALPLFRNILTWDQAIQFGSLGKDGYQAFEDFFTLDFLSNECLWTVSK